MRSTTFDIGGIGLPVKALGIADIFAPWGDIAEFESHARTRYHAYKVGEPEDMKAALEVEAPGCTEDEIDVSVNTDSANKNILLIKARRKEGGPRLGRDFEHSFQLPNGAEVERADLDRGILTILIKERVAETGGRKIAVGSGKGTRLESRAEA